MKPAFLTTLLTISTVVATAQNNSNEVHISASCLELNQAAVAQAASGHLAEAEASLPAATISSGERDQCVCRGYILSNIAAIVFVSGRTADAEGMAEQGVRLLDQFYPPNDWMLLRPLQILAAVRLESGKTARAREAVKRIQAIQIKGPEDSAMVHSVAGALLQIEGRRSEAEAEYHGAFRALEEAGRSESQDAAAILHCLASLYLKEQRLEEAARTLDRALAIYNRAKDTVPYDRIKFLDLRAVLHARLGEWQQSEQDLHDALSMADGQPSTDQFFLRALLANYSYVLRRNHHAREARSIEARTAALPADGTARAIVDFTDLLVEKKDLKK
jgi:tetratricopeptide (TPR) repeat protein